jgi:hypothetical protein
VLTAAQLLSEGGSEQQPGGFAAGFDWAAEQLRQAGYEQLAAEVSSTVTLFTTASGIDQLPRKRLLAWLRKPYLQSLQWM